MLPVHVWSSWGPILERAVIIQLSASAPALLYLSVPVLAPESNQGQFQTRKMEKYWSIVCLSKNIQLNAVPQQCGYVTLYRNFKEYGENN